MVATRPCINGEFAFNRHGCNRLVHITTAAGIALSTTFEAFEVPRETLAPEAIGEGTGADHCLSTAHTLERYEQAFCTPSLSNWDGHDTWVEGDTIDTHARANSTWKKLWSQ
jgi:trimethylamine:corrinoid methyltransferase-like protein